MDSVSPIALQFNITLEPDEQRSFVDFLRSVCRAEPASEDDDVTSRVLKRVREVGICRAIDYCIMEASAFNDLRGEELFNILEHCGELGQLLDAMPQKGEDKLYKANEAGEHDLSTKLEAKWLKRLDAFRLAQREKSPSEDLWSRARKMAAAIGVKD